MRLSIQFLTIVLILVLAPLAFAGTLEEAAAAQERGDNVTALAIATPLAEQGDSMAQVFVGQLHNDSTPAGLTTAIGWFKKSAAQGNPAAIKILAFYKGMAQGWLEAQAKDSNNNATNTDTAEMMKLILRLVDQ